MKIKIGFWFCGLNNWSGGLIYFSNFVKATCNLSDEKRPEIYIYYNIEDDIKEIRNCGFGNIKFFKLNNFSLQHKILNYVSVKIRGKFLSGAPIPDISYPHKFFVPTSLRKIYWIPDFQERYLPQYFSKFEILKRNIEHKIQARSKGVIVFSSCDAMNDFKKFYPKYNAKLELLHFACIQPKFDFLDVELLKEKYGIQKDYFFAPNQFWQHKNHLLLFKAINILSKRGYQFQVVLSGKECDRRNKEYYPSLIEYIKTNDLDRWIKIIGFIDRSEQLCLMNEAIAIIQPSLFEGWSTVVEDAKSLNQFMILSDLNVHKEQIKSNCFFYDRNDEFDLASKIETILDRGAKKPNIDYNLNIEKFSQDIFEIFDNYSTGKNLVNNF